MVLPIANPRKFLLGYRYFFADDLKHTEIESRYIALGKTKRNRLLSVVFTIRGKKIRNISARDMSKKDRKIYGKQEI